MHLHCLCRPVKSTPRVEVIDAATQQRFDPTGTNKIRVAFTSDMDARWNRLKRMTLEAVKTRFTNAMTNVNAAALSGHSPLTAFQLWFDEALNQVVFGYNGSWTAKYIRSGSDKGEAHANSALLVHDAFDPNQPRDKDGQWTEAEGAPKIEKMRTDIESGDPKEFSSRMKWNADYDEVTISGGAVYPALRVIDRNTGKVAGVLVGRRGYAHGDVASDHGVDSELVMGGLRHREGSIDYERGFVQRKKYYRAEDVDLDTAVLAPHSKYAVKDAVDDRTPLLQSLTVSELQGVMEAVSQQAVRAYANGLLTNASAPYLAQSINSAIDKIGKVRSHSLIQFMVVRAHALATIAVFRAANVPSVGTVAESVRSSSPSLGGLTLDARRKKVRKDLVEVITAGDHKVCPICEDISESGPYTLDEAERLLPAHPNCRCAFVPWHDARFASVHSEDAFSEEKHPRGPDGQWINAGSDSIFAYHGTTSDVADEIIKNGLKVGQGRTYADGDLYLDDRGHSVFVAASQGIAEYYATQRIKNKGGGTPIIFKLQIPKKDWEEFKNDDMSSFGTRFGAAHSTKSIPPEWIVSQEVIKDAGDLLTIYMVVSVIDVPVQDADVTDDKDALGHGSFAHNIAHTVGHHIGHRVRHVFKGHHSREHANKELEKNGYTHEHSFATSGNNNNHIHVGYYSHTAGHKAEVLTEEKFDENGNQLTSTSSVKVQEAKKQQKVNDADFDESKHPRDKLGKFTDADLKKQHEDYQSQMKNKNISTQKFYSLARKRDEIYNEIKRRSESKSSSKISQAVIDPKVGAAKAIYNSVEKGDESSSSAVEKFSQEQKKAYKDLASASSLSKKETDALKTYTSDKGYKEINAALRSGKSHPLVSDLDKVASSVTLKKDLVAYRGLLHGDGYKAGKPFTEKSYMSLSMDYDTARSFSTGHADELAGSVVEFLIPAGTKIGFGKKSESEIILPRNTSGEIDAKKYVMQSGQSTILTGRLKKKRAVRDAFDPNEPRDKNGQWTKAGGEDDNEPDITVYHGTTRVLLQSIKKHGLVPSALQEEIIGKNALGSDAWAEKYGMDIQRFNIGDRALSVYITPNPRTAADFAGYASEVNNSEPVILKLKIPKEKAKDIFVDELSGEVMDAYRFKGHVTPDMIDNVAFTKRGKVELSSITDAAGDIVLYAVIFVDGKNAEEES